jgi:signal transduction histidine kinase
MVSNNTKDRLFRIIVNDLRNPIAQMRQFSNHIEEELDRLSQEEIKVLIKSMQDSSLQSLKLLENLLDWARSQTGSMAFNPTYIDLKTLIDDVKGLHLSISCNKKITLESNITETHEVYADYNMMHTVLRNLISNAIKYTPPGGKIKIDFYSNEHMDELSVEDNGVGMKATTVDRLFQIDSAESSPGTNNEKGTGIGLVLCKELIDRHNGRIIVESVMRKGSIFRIMLPKSGSTLTEV